MLGVIVPSFSIISSYLKTFNRLDIQKQLRLVHEKPFYIFVDVRHSLSVILCLSLFDLFLM